MPVIGGMLVCNWHSIHNLFAVAVYIENSLVWPNLLSCREFIACSISAHT